MLVEFKKANICQTEGENVLDGVDFSVNEGDFIYLIGRVGSGKSSLLKSSLLKRHQLLRILL